MSSQLPSRRNNKEVKKSVISPVELIRIKYPSANFKFRTHAEKVDRRVKRKKQVLKALFGTPTRNIRSTTFLADHSKALT